MMRTLMAGALVMGLTACAPGAERDAPAQRSAPPAASTPPVAPSPSPTPESPSSAPTAAPPSSATPKPALPQGQLDQLLRDAAWANDVPAARELITQGADVNAKDATE